METTMSGVAWNYEMKSYLPVLDELRVVLWRSWTDRFNFILVVGLMLLLEHDICSCDIYMFLDNATHGKMFTSHAVWYNATYPRQWEIHTTTKRFQTHTHTEICPRVAPMSQFFKLNLGCRHDSFKDFVSDTDMWIRTLYWNRVGRRHVSFK
jgi:hypothetical protein